MIEKRKRLLTPESTTGALRFLQEYYRAHGVLPSFSAIAENTGLSSKASAKRVIEDLQEAKLLDAAPDGRLKPGPAFFERPQGRPIPAGVPDEGDAFFDERIAIDSYLVDHPAHTTIHPIHGDSMVERGLYDGDKALVHRGAPAKPGSIVLASIDGTETIKVLAKDATGLYLMPANPAYKALRPRTDLTILGVITGTFGRR